MNKINELLPKALLQSYEGFLLSDREGRIFFANAAVEVISGTKLDRIIGKTPEEMQEDGLILYAAATAAVVDMTKTWAKELEQKGINVNAVAPGFTLTSMVESIPENVVEKMKAMIPLQRLGTPEDIVSAYLLLASDEASYVHGHVLHVDGAIVM